MIKIKYLVAPIIVCLGLLAFLFGRTVEAKIIAKHDFAATVAWSQGLKESDVKYQFLSIQELGLGDISDFEDISSVIEAKGFTLLEDHLVVCTFGITAPCEDLQFGHIIFQDSENSETFYGLSYGHKLGLKGCEKKVLKFVSVTQLDN